MTTKIIKAICVLVSVTLFSIIALTSLHFGLLGPGVGMISVLCANGILLTAPLSWLVLKFSNIAFYLLVALQIAMFLYLAV